MAWVRKDWKGGFWPNCIWFPLKCLGYLALFWKQLKPMKGELGVVLEYGGLSTGDVVALGGEQFALLGV